MFKVVQLGRAVATAVFGLFAAGAALAKALGAGATVVALLAAVGLAGGLMALGLLWLEREAMGDEASDQRVSRALNALGDVAARVGAVYQLEALARQNPARHGDIVYAVLNDFIREHTSLASTSAGRVDPDSPAQVAAVRRDEADDDSDEADRRPPSDVQAALRVLGRREPPPKDSNAPRLSRADLRGATLRGARLDGVRLRGARLDYAHLEGATLQRAKLRKSVLKHADLGPDLDLDLAAADLTEAGLPGADLSYAKLRDALLTGADLTGATLCGTDLRGADLRGATLTDATYDADTKPPAGFDLEAAGARPAKGE